MSFSSLQFYARSDTVSMRQPGQPLPSRPCWSWKEAAFGEWSPFPSIPTQPQTPAIFCFSTGRRLEFHMEDRGATEGWSSRTTQAAWPCNNSGVSESLRHFTTLRSWGSNLREAVQQVQEHSLKPVCQGLKPGSHLTGFVILGQ